MKIHQHELAYYSMCEFKFMMNRKYQKKVQKHYINAGTLFAHGVYNLHLGKEFKDCIDEIDLKCDELIATMTSQEKIEETLLQSEIIKAMLSGYANKFMAERNQYPYIQSIAPEYHITHESGDITLVGRLDGDVYDTDGKRWIMELKTTTQVDRDMVRRLPVDFQNNFYFFMCSLQGESPIGVIYRWCRKSALKQKQKETIHEYRSRILDDYIDRPDFYFVEDAPLFDLNATERFRYSIASLLFDLRMNIRSGDYPKRYTGCKVGYSLCHFIEYCLNPTKETLETYYTERTDHATDTENQTED